MTPRRVLSAVGLLFTAGGALLVLFVAFQLWGTTVLQARAQARLRTQFSTRLPHDAGRSARQLAGGPTTARPGPPEEPGASPRVAPSVRPPPPGRPVGVIDIPAIALDQVVVEGVDERQLALGPGHYPGTPLPGEAGNAAIAGHRTTYGHPFYSLDALRTGDAIVLTTPQGAFSYSVTGEAVVDPTDVSVIAPTSGTQLTLTTCNPRYSAEQRLVVHAVLARSVLFPGSASALAPGQTASEPHPPRPGRGTATTAGLGGSWLPPLAWGVALLVVVATAVPLVRRSRHHWIVASGAGVLTLGVLFFFFASLGPLLPSSL